MPEIEIRLLTKSDAPDYQQLRLKSLQTDSAAFLSTFEMESKLHDIAFADHLDWAYHPPSYGYFGLFSDGKLAGYIQTGKNYLEKQAHVASLYNLYVDPDHRHKGFARQLMDFVMKLLLEEENIERVFLSCTAKNPTAYTFYKRLGFHRIGVKVKAIKWNGQYDDEIEMVKLLRK